MKKNRNKTASVEITGDVGNKIPLEIIELINYLSKHDINYAHIEKTVGDKKYVVSYNLDKEKTNELS